MRVDTIKKTIAWKSSLSGEMGRSIPIKDTKHGYKMCVYIKNVAGKVALRLYRFKAASEPLSEASAVNNQPTESKTAIATTTAETVQSAPAEKAANASDEDLKNDAQNQVSVVQRGPNEECYDDQKAEQAVRLNERFKTFPMGYYWTASDDHNLNKTHSACDEGSYSAYGAMVVDMHLPGIHEWSFDLETNGSCTGTGRIAVGIDEADAMALDQSFYTRKDTCNYAWLNSGHVCSQAKWDRYEPDTDTYTTQTSRLLMFVDAANKTIAWKSSRSNLGEIGAPIPIKSAEQGYRMCVSIQNGDDEVTIRTYQFTPASASRSQSETAESAAESKGTAVEKRRCSAPLNSVKTVETIQPAPVDKAAHSVLNMADPALIQPSKCSVCNERGSKRCTGCNAVWYCSKEHQVIHWRSSHKHECKKLSTELCRKTNTGGDKNATDAVRVERSCGESVANDAVDSSDSEWSASSSGEEDGQKAPLDVASFVRQFKPEMQRQITAKEVDAYDVDACLASLIQLAHNNETVLFRLECLRDEFGEAIPCSDLSDACEDVIYGILEEFGAWTFVDYYHSSDATSCCSTDTKNDDRGVGSVVSALEQHLESERAALQEQQVAFIKQQVAFREQQVAFQEQQARFEQLRRETASPTMSLPLLKLTWASLLLLLLLLCQVRTVARSPDTVTSVSFNSLAGEYGLALSAKSKLSVALFLNDAAAVFSDDAVGDEKAVALHYKDVFRGKHLTNSLCFTIVWLKTCARSLKYFGASYSNVVEPLCVLLLGISDSVAGVFVVILGGVGTKLVQCLRPPPVRDKLSALCVCSERQVCKEAVYSLYVIFLYYTPLPNLCIPCIVLFVHMSIFCFFCFSFVCSLFPFSLYYFLLYLYGYCSHVSISGPLCLEQTYAEDVSSAL